ncbi:MAG: hypothetical protein QM765_10900 [Myxococcales bacterium]
MVGPQFATSASRTVAGTTFTWEFNCGGRACRHGTFVNGEPWVAAIDDLGARVAAVTLTNILPAGTQHGAEANSKDYTRHGILPYHPLYDASLNVMEHLPFAAAPNTSIFKAFVDGTVNGCRSAQGCVASDDVLTVLSDAPEDEGATVFRPPFHGDWKPLFSLRNVRLERLSSLPQVSTTVFAKDSFASRVPAVVERWTVPAHIVTHINGDTDLYRILSPLAVLSNYGAYQAGAYNEDVEAMLGSEPVSAKAPAIYALLQKGIDVYGAFRADVPLGSGAGQHLGQKPALAFFAALYDDPAVLSEVRSIASNQALLDRGFFQEDTQVARSITGEPVWGEVWPDLETRYWAGYFGTWAAVNLGGTGSDRNGAHGDPYRYIDGPGGGMAGNQPSSRNYQTVAVTYLVGYAFNLMRMPWYAHASNDSEITDYADRINGYGLPGFAGGFWSLPDECAGADDRETVACDPWGLGAGCQYYQLTWGPDPNAPGQCIKYSGNPHTTHGRWPTYHGTKLADPSTLWTLMRQCLDSSSSTYGTGDCSGLGPLP